MSTAMGSFDKSPLDAFVKSPLDARNAPGGILWLAGFPNTRFSESEFRDYLSSYTGYDPNSIHLILNDLDGLLNTPLDNYSLVIYDRHTTGDWPIPTVERLSGFAGRFVMQTDHFPPESEYAWAQFDLISSLTGLNFGQHGPGSENLTFVPSNPFPLMEGIDGFYLGPNTDVFGCTGGNSLLDGISTFRASEDSRFVMIADDANFIGHSRNPSSPGYAYHDRVRRFYTNLRDVPVGA